MLGKVPAQPMGRVFCRRIVLQYSRNAWHDEPRSFIILQIFNRDRPLIWLAGLQGLLFFHIPILLRFSGEITPTARSRLSRPTVELHLGMLWQAGAVNSLPAPFMASLPPELPARTLSVPSACWSCDRPRDTAETGAEPPAGPGANPSAAPDPLTLLSSCTATPARAELLCPCPHCQEYHRGCPRAK